MAGDLEAYLGGLSPLVYQAIGIWPASDGQCTAAAGTQLTRRGESVSSVSGGEVPQPKDSFESYPVWDRVGLLAKPFEGGK